MTPLFALSACRRAAGRALSALAGKLLETERENVTFTEAYYDGVLPLSRHIAYYIGLGQGFGRVALVRRRGTPIVELMSEVTYRKLYGQGVER